MAHKSVVIVGGGIAGLAAGCYARMNGYPATILEMHDIPGGLCTAWKRKGYTFDISMHMVTGSKSGAFHTMWQELGALDGRRFVYHSELGRLESRGKVLEFVTDRRRIEQQMLALSPADARLIRELLDLLFGRSLLAAASLTPAELSGPLDSLRMLVAFAPFLPAFVRYRRQTVQEFAERFQDPFLRQAVRFIIDAPGWPMPRFPMFALAGFIPGAVAESGVPVGGSQQVVLAIAERFRRLGGELRCKTRVEDVVVRNDRAVGVRLADGSEVSGDTVVWAGDGHTLIFDLLQGRYVNDAIRRMYDTWTPVRPLVHVALGVARDMSAEPRGVSFELERPITIAGEERRWLQVIHHSFDPTMAPPGKAAVEVWYPCRFDYWQELARDRDRYKAEKKSIADLTVAELDKRWPGFAAQVEVVDVPTPATYARYTGNWQGSPDGWYITPDNMKSTPVHTLPGLADLYMAGQWTAPFTGTVIAALSARQAIQLLCKQDRMPFRTTT